jgi:hypothetical protein
MPNPAEAIDRLAAELDEIERHEVGIAVEYARGGTVFAVREGLRVSLRLRPEVVEAALQTPDTARSHRGNDWIALQPRVVDGFALDRALAWFESAWRLAGELSEGRPPLSRPN